MKGVGRLRKWISDLRRDRIHARHRARHLDTYSRIDEIVARYRSNGGLNHPYQHYKLFELRELLAQFKPPSILELGSGTTTSIVADYVRAGPNRSAVVVDENEQWLENARQIAGVSIDDSRFDFVASPTREDRTRPGTGYKYTPVREFDFVLVDGPSLIIDGKKNKRAVNLDIFDLPTPPKVVVIDIRSATVDALQQRNDYVVKVSDVIVNNIQDGYQYFSVGTLKV